MDVTTIETLLGSRLVDVMEKQNLSQGLAADCHPMDVKTIETVLGRLLADVMDTQSLPHGLAADCHPMDLTTMETEILGSHLEDLTVTQSLPQQTAIQLT